MVKALQWANYVAKFLIATATVTVLVVNDVLEDGIFTTDEWFPIIIAIFGAVSTFLKANGSKPS